MLAVQKLAIEALKEKNSACGSFIAMYDYRFHDAINKIHGLIGTEDYEYKHSANLLNPELKKNNRHALIKLQEACYAQWTSMHSHFHPRTDRYNSLQSFEQLKKQFEKKKVPFPRHHKMMKELFNIKGPQYMAILTRNQLAPRGITKYKGGEKNVSVDWKASRKDSLFAGVEEVYNHLLEASPWATEHLVGKNHSFEKHMNEGMVINCEKLSLQKAFAIAMLFRQPVEASTGVVYGYKSLVDYGFDPQTAAVLSLFIHEQVQVKFANGVAHGVRGGGHSFVNTDYMADEAWEAILEGKYAPKWTQHDVWKNQGRAQFNLFNATQWGHHENDLSYRVQHGEGWDKSWKINVKKLKEYYDANRAA